MARPRKADAPDLAKSHDLTAGAIERLNCPPGKTQAFLRDTASPGLRVRVTAAGAKSFVFEAKLNRQTIRRTIGDVRAWTIEDARREANRLRVTLDHGDDPRELERQKAAAKAAAAQAATLAAAQASLTVGEAWTAYLQDRRPHWGELHYRDHVDKAKPGGEPGRPRSKVKLTRPGPLHALMALPLSTLDAPTVEAWATREAQTRPTSARLAWRLLKVFLNWCAEHETYGPLLQTKNAAASKKAREALGTPATKTDVLQREQLAAWFRHVASIPNRTVSACLQVMLLTGARPGEVLSLRWDDVDTQWKGLTIRDKVEGLRTIPLTPYVAHLLAGLPRVNAWVFASARWVQSKDAPAGRWQNTSASGRIAEPNTPHTKACTAAGLMGLTLHGLRRSFASLTEWLEIPAGVVAQIQGHKPSATAEKHYKIRPLELLRVHHERIEAWMLEQAGIPYLAADFHAPQAPRLALSK
ncbi:MAG: integrase family protein [Inhella sp.]